MLFQMWQAIGNPVTALADLVKRVLRPQQFRNTADECEALSRQKGRGTILAVQSLQVRLVLEQLQLAGRSGHVQINHAPHFSRKLRRQLGEWTRRIARKVQRGKIPSA